MKLTKDEVIDRIKNIHGDKYGGVDDINYINIGTKIKLICPIHKDFYITPKSIFNGCGCRKCSQIANAIILSLQSCSEVQQEYCAKSN